MIERNDGAVLVAGGAVAMRGMPSFSAAGPSLAAQRNYLQSLESEVKGKGIYIGRLYIGVVIERSAWHARQEAAKATGGATSQGPAVSPDYLADLLWDMHHSRKEPETVYPEGLFDR